MKKTLRQNGSTTQLRPERGTQQHTMSKSQRLDVPSYYAASVQVLVSGNNLSLLFTTPHPAITEQGDLVPLPINEPVALIHMSRAGLKDLSIILTDTVFRLEGHASPVRKKTGENTDADAQ